MNRRKDEVLKALADERTALDSRLDTLHTQGEEFKASLDPKSLWKRSFSEHPTPWILGAMAAGVVGARLLIGPRRDTKSPSMQKSTSQEWKSALPTVPIAAGFLVRAAFKAVRPGLEKILRERTGEMLGDLSRNFFPPAGSPGSSDRDPQQ